MTFAREAKRTPVRKSELKSRLPVVCVLAIEGTKDFKELTSEFNNHIKKLEKQVFDQNSANKPNFNEKIHRIQFGKINLSRNPKFRNDVVNRVKKANPKYVVYVSEVELVGVFNNVQDLEYVIEDALHGEYNEMSPLKEVMEHDYEIHEILTNETLSVMRVVLYHLTSSLFYRIALFVLSFFVFTKVIKINNKKALIVSGVLLGSMVVYGIVEKLVVESII